MQSKKWERNGWTCRLFMLAIKIEPENADEPTTTTTKMKEAKRIEQRHNKLYYAILWLVGFFCENQVRARAVRTVNYLVNKMPIAAIRKWPRANNWCTFSFSLCVRARARAILIGFFFSLSLQNYMWMVLRLRLESFSVVLRRPIHLLCAMNDSKTTNE